MGIWGGGSFDNDEALDWLESIEHVDDTAFLREALTPVVENEEIPLDYGDCSVAVAAAEIIAAMKNCPAPDLPEEAVEWLEDHPLTGVGTELIELALLTLIRVKAGSELKEIWDESDEAGVWYSAVTDLERRLKRALEL